MHARTWSQARLLGFKDIAPIRSKHGIIRPRFPIHHIHKKRKKAYMMHEAPGFDESDGAFMSSVGHAIALLVPLVFPGLVEVLGKTHTLHYADVESMCVAEIERFFSVVEKCLGGLYIKHKGVDWKSDKIDEMAESGLVYVWYENKGSITSFVSLMMVLEPSGKTLYLYEIHVLPEFQGHHLGAMLMNSFHALGTLLNSKAQDETSNLRPHFASVATGLTVFSDNEKALRWYLKIGYKFAVDSPLDKHLRNGKLMKPPFYVLSRPLDGSSPKDVQAKVQTS